jgi:hypothetical protein
VRGRNSQSPARARSGVRDDKGAHQSATVEGEGEAGLAGPIVKLGCGHRGGGGGLRWSGEKTRGTGRLKRMGLAQLERKFIYFPNFSFSAKTIPRKPRNCLKALKILRKS